MTDLDRLVAYVDQAGTRGAGRDDLVDHLGMPEADVQLLARLAVDADRAYLADRRIYSTGPFEEPTAEGTR